MRTAAATICLLTLALAGCSQDDGNADEGVSPIVKVAIDEFRFEPATVSSPSNGMVEWTNNDEATHAVAIGDEEKGDLVQPGETLLLNALFFEKSAGEYHCAIHPNMTGKVEIRRT